MKRFFISLAQVCRAGLVQKGACAGSIHKHSLLTDEQFIYYFIRVFEIGKTKFDKPGQELTYYIGTSTHPRRAQGHTCAIKYGSNNYLMSKV